MTIHDLPLPVGLTAYKASTSPSPRSTTHTIRILSPILSWLEDLDQETCRVRPQYRTVAESLSFSPRRASAAASRDILELGRCTCNARKPKGILASPATPSPASRYVQDADGRTVPRSISVAGILVRRRGIPCCRTWGTRRAGPREGAASEELARPKKPGTGPFPCIFPADQGFECGDEFALDCLLRQDHPTRGKQQRIALAFRAPNEGAARP